MLDTVCCDLIQDQAEWYCAIDRQLELVGLHVDFDPLGLLLDGKTKPQAAGRQRRARPQRERFAEVFEENQRRQWVPLSDIPEHVQKAFLAAEDKRFYRHKGIDERGLIRAFIGNLAQSGRPQGGSTITQQIVKNLLVGEDLTYDRKIREMIVASRVEHTLSKAEILELYLNSVYLGRVRSPRACPDRNSQFDSRHAPAANQIDHVTLRPGAAALAMATNTLRVFLRSPKQARLAAGWAARASRRCHAKAEVRV